MSLFFFFFFFQAEDGIRDLIVTGVQTCALPIFAETPVADCLANLPNESDQKAQVVDRRQPVPQDFAGHEEVPQIRPAKPLARIAIATVIRWTRVLDEPTVA